MGSSDTARTSTPGSTTSYGASDPDTDSTTTSIAFDSPSAVRERLLLKSWQPRLSGSSVWFYHLTSPDRWVPNLCHCDRFPDWSPGIPGGSLVFSTALEVHNPERESLITKSPCCHTDWNFQIALRSASKEDKILELDPRSFAQAVEVKRGEDSMQVSLAESCLGHFIDCNASTDGEFKHTIMTRVSEVIGSIERAAVDLANRKANTRRPGLAVRLVKAGWATEEGSTGWRIADDGARR